MSKTDDDDEDHAIESHGIALRESLRPWLKQYFGERCQDFEAGCLGCEAWKAFDAMFGMLPEREVEMSDEDMSESAEAECRLRKDIEEAIEEAADCMCDATEWWAKEESGPRTIDTLIGMIVVAAKQYQKALEVQRIPQRGDKR